MSAIIGRPPMYKTPEEIEAKIMEYFAECESKPVLDGEGKQVIDETGRPAFYPGKPPTVSGLAYHLGFTSRQALLNYQGKRDFVDTVTRAKLYIEAYTEGRLFDRDGVQGAKFSLSNNFRGWRDKPPEDNSAETLDKLDKILTNVSKAASRPKRGRR